MTETLCTSGAVKLKAGANASTALTAAQYTQMINQAESWVSLNSKYDWVTNYSSVPTNSKLFLEDATASKAAIFAINYDMSNYSSRQESQVMLDVNYTNVVDTTNLLRDSKFVDFLKSGTTN
jgi:hypothetical protein